MRALLISAVGLATLIALGACGGDDGETTTGSGASGGGAAGSSGSGASGSAGGTGATGSGTGTGGSTGGAGGGAAGSGGSGGAPAAMAECTDDAGCKVVDDCCNCLGIPTSEAPPVCNITNCKQSTCSADALPNPTAACKVGQCIVGFACDHTKVGCDSPPPACPPGQTASIEGICWGPCVPTTECTSVGGCDQCAATEACVQEVTQLGLISHCVETPAACAGKPTCACMGAAVCVGSFNLCNDTPEGISCGCPTC